MNRISKTLDLDKLSVIRCIPKGCKRIVGERLSSMGCRTDQEKMAAITAMHPVHIGEKLQGLNGLEQRDGAAPPAKARRLLALPQLPLGMCTFTGAAVSIPEVQSSAEDQDQGYGSLPPPHPALAAYPGEFTAYILCCNMPD